jgi:peroxiredoxin
MLGPGNPAPNISGIDIISGDPFSLSDCIGKVVCLAFIKYTCGNCAAELPRVQNLWMKYKDHGVQMVASLTPYSSTEVQERTWLAGLVAGGITFPVIRDPTSTNWPQYSPGSISFPLLYVIDRNQVISYCHSLGEPESVTDGHILDAIYVRNPVDLEMVLDISDSMNDAPAGGDSKVTIMKQAAKMIVDFLHDHAQTGDRTGLVWFTDDVSEHAMVPIVSDWLDLKNHIDAQGTGTCTAMGAGLQTAFNALSSSSQKRFAILLTDGIQNIEPKVAKVGSHFEIIDGGGWCGGHSSVAAKPGVDIATYNTKVHTIGVGIAATYASLLQDLANGLDGFYLGTNDPGHDLDLIYFVDLCNCLAGGSPVIVHHHAGTFCPEECQSVEIFRLNKSVRKITIILSWEKSLAGSLAFWLRAPNGTLLDLHEEMKLYDTYAMATIYLPKKQDGEWLPYVGEWQTTIRGETSDTAAYHALVLAEDPETHFAFDYPKKVYEIGDIVPLHIKMKEAEHHLIHASEIVLEKATPCVPMAELLAQNRVTPYQLSERLKVGVMGNKPNLLELKLSALSRDQRFQERLLPIRKKFSLREGTLKCQITEKEIILPVSLTESGLNTFRIDIQYETKDNGPISRVAMVSVHVDPGKVESTLSNVSLIPVSKEKEKGALIQVTPRNAAGHLLGPGHAEEIGVLIGEQNKVKCEVEDLLDGTYRIELLSLKRKAISLTFKDKVFWKGSIEK